MGGVARGQKGLKKVRRDWRGLVRPRMCLGTAWGRRPRQRWSVCGSRWGLWAQQEQEAEEERRRKGPVCTLQRLGPRRL